MRGAVSALLLARNARRPIVSHISNLLVMVREGEPPTTKWRLQKCRKVVGGLPAQTMTHEYGEQGANALAHFLFAHFPVSRHSRETLLPLRQYVLFLFSAISAMFGAVSIHLEEFRTHPPLRPIRQ